MKIIHDVVFCFQPFTKRESIGRLHFSYISFCILVNIPPTEMEFRVFNAKSTKVQKIINTE